MQVELHFLNLNRMSSAIEHEHGLYQVLAKRLQSEISFYQI
jgi:hypothetical protein